ncbi:MAG: sigma-70 family RNA polymerase sigma factor [Acidobacteria bacterium]|nr:sigma-70 family RNA polymerase sigma factor [Acidobacteriota bacterium]
MLSLCRRCTRQEADAEEAFSRASLLLYHKLPAYLERVENLRGWILRLTFNACMSLHRESRRRGEQSLEEIGAASLADEGLLDTSPEGDPESSYLQKEMSQFLRSSIENLPERLRDTMIGHLSLGSYREIADRLAINEANARKRMQEAREVLSRGLAQYRAGVARPPAPPPGRPAKPRRAASASAAGDPPERVRALRAVVVTLPGGVERQRLLALRLPLGKERRDALERYVEQHPGGGTKRLALARALLEEGRAEEALPHLEHGVERQPRRLDAWLDLIATCRLLERPAAAAGACERALAVHRGPAAALLQGLHAQCLGRTAEAERAFRDARDAMPESPAPWTALAELQRATGRPHEAAGSLEEALARSPTDVAALTLGAEPLRLLGRSAEARRRDARALEVDAANPPALERRLVAAARSAGGRLAPEGGLWRAVERLARTRAVALSLLSFLRVCGGDLAGAGEMASCVAARPQLAEARIARARLLDALDRPLLALQEVDVARTLQAPARELDLLACRISLRGGLSWRTLQESEDLLARHGDAWDTASTAAWALVHLGRTDRAIELSQAAVARQPGLPAAWLEHGRVLARAARLQEAVAATETGWSLLPEGDGFDLAAPAALDLAVLHRRLGYPEWARQWALQALESCVALAGLDPVRARIFRVWIQAELGSEAAPSTAGTGPEDLSPSFLQIEERRLLTNQLSETSFG